MSSSVLKKFKEFATINPGQSPKSEFYSKTGGTPFLQGNRTFGLLYPTIDTYTKSITKLAEKGEILMSVRAPVGDLNYANSEICIGRGIASINAKDGDNKFFFYCLKYNIQNLIRQGSGTTYDAVNKDIVNDFDLIMPENRIERENIGITLSDLDAKIELNNKINQELEAMAKTLYDYWFVQFDFPCLPENYKFSGAGKPEPSSAGMQFTCTEGLKVPCTKGLQGNHDLPTEQFTCTEGMQGNHAKKIGAVCTYSQVGGLPIPNGKSWFVYVIECVDGTFYKGMTNDLYRRYYEHYTGQGAEWTKVHKPKRVIHYEEFDSQCKAAEREKELKSGFGRTWFQREYSKFIKYGYPKKGGSPAHQTSLRMAGKMVYNNELKREIPEGWEVDIVGNLLAKDINTRKIPSREYLDNGLYPIIDQSTSFICGFTNDESYLIETKVPKIIFGDHTRILKLINFNFARGADGTQVLQSNNKRVPQYYFYHTLIEVDLSNYGYARHFKFLKDRRIIIPNYEISEKFEEIAKNNYKQISHNIFETQKLTELRDWLLPMLMNGQVTVKEATKHTPNN